jgi:hypothetical protein
MTSLVVFTVIVVAAPAGMMRSSRPARNVKARVQQSSIRRTVTHLF